MSEEDKSLKSLKKSKDELEEAQGHGDIHITRQETIFFVCEAICILFYGLFTTYDG